MNILGFDPGYNLGWASMLNGQLVEYDVLKSSKLYNDRGNRFFELGAIVSDLIDRFNPDIIAYEHVMRWMSSDAALAYNGCLAQILAESYSHEVPTIGYAVTSIKKHVTDNGKATKEDMIAWANTTYKLSITDDNIADAIAVARTATDLLDR